MKIAVLILFFFGNLSIYAQSKNVQAKRIIKMAAFDSNLPEVKSSNLKITKTNQKNSLEYSAVEKVTLKDAKIEFNSYDKSGLSPEVYVITNFKPIQLRKKILNFSF